MSEENITIPGERRVALLKALPSFETLPDEALLRVAEALVEECFAVGEIIVRESQVGDRMYVIERGTVRVSVHSAKGEVDLGHMHAGDVFGEIALLSDTKRRRASVFAETPVVTFSLNLSDFENVIRLFPEVRDDLAYASDALMQARLEALMQARREQIGGNWLDPDSK